MSEKVYHNYPDKNVTKVELCEEWFPMSSATCNRLLAEVRQVKRFRDIEVRVGHRVLINVRGFFEFLAYREKHRFRV